MKGKRAVTIPILRYSEYSYFYSMPVSLHVCFLLEMYMQFTCLSYYVVIVDSDNCYLCLFFGCKCVSIFILRFWLLPVCVACVSVSNHVMCVLLYNHNYISHIKSNFLFEKAPPGMEWDNNYKAAADTSSCCSLAGRGICSWSV